MLAHRVGCRGTTPPTSDFAMRTPRVMSKTGNLRQKRAVKRFKRHRRQAPPKVMEFTLPSPDGDFETIEAGVRNENPEIVDVLREHWHDIRTSYTRSKSGSTKFYNFRMTELNVTQIEDWVRAVFERQKTMFHMNIEFGYMLLNTEQLYHHEGDDNDVETDEPLFRHFYNAHNTKLFDQAEIMDTAESLKKVIKMFRKVDLVEWATNKRPNSKWRFHQFTNVTIKVIPVASHPIIVGSASPHLPEYIRRNPSISSLQVNRTTGKRYQDKLCLFRCLALHAGRSVKSFEMSTKNLARRWSEYKSIPDISSKGVPLTEIDEFQEFYGVPIAMYELQPFSACQDDWGDDMFATPVERPRPKKAMKDFQAVLVREPSLKSAGATLNVLLYGNHCCFIHDIQSFCRSWSCQKCPRVFDHYSHFIRHTEECKGGDKTSYKFPGGAYNLRKTVKEELELLGFNVSQFDWFYPHFAVFDCESYQRRIRKRVVAGLAAKTKHKTKLTLASIAVASNIPGYRKGKFLLSKGKPKDLVRRFIKYLSKVQKAASEKVRDTFSDLFSEIQQALRDAKRLQASSSPLWIGSRGYIDRLERVKAQFESWIDDLVVFSFNGGKFDMNLLRRHMFPLIRDKQPRLLKRGNAYLSVQFGNIRMLDVSNHLSAGVSYDAWLKAYKIPLRKFHWPHSWFTSLKKLKQRFVPPIEAYNSRLKGTSLSTAEYEDILRKWIEKHMKKMKHMLKFYSLLDVEPFVLAVLKMMRWWRSQGIDMLRHGISLPGLALRHLFAGIPDTEVFELPNEKNQELFWLMKKNVVGGPSLVMHRYHEKGKTRIRGPHGKLCQTILGLDANALYLYCLMLAKPTGIYHRWLPVGKRGRWLRRVRSTNVSNKELQWLAFEASKRGVKILSRYNGRQQNFGTGEKIGKYKSLLVDGFDPTNGRVFEFLGCYWHGHSCQLNGDSGSERSNAARKDTKDRLNHIRQLGFETVSIWECQFEHLLSTDSDLSEFVQKQFQIGEKTKTMLEKAKLLERVESGEFFGLLEVDISVPENLRTYFEEMPPIFKNATVQRKNVGSFMRKYAKRNGIMRQPRRLLISSYFGDKILLNSRLLQWYLKKGLEVKNIHQAFEFKPSACFHEKGELVAEHRRAADIDPDKSIIAEMFKTTGNCYYGKTITDKIKQRQVALMGYDQLQKVLTDPLFCDVDEIDAETFEVKTMKKTTVLDEPNIIGFDVYQNAKLRMLEFLYDFIDKFVDRTDYQLIQMDTGKSLLPFLLRMLFGDASVLVYIHSHIFELELPRYVSFGT